MAIMKVGILRLFCLVPLILLINLSVTPASAQQKPKNTRPRNKKKSIPLKEALDRLENYYKVELVFLNADLPNVLVAAVPITGNFKSDLNRQVAAYGLEVTRISDQQFVLNKKQADQQSNQIKERWTEGKVYTANDHIPLEGANITATVSGHVTHTDQHGYFKIKTLKDEPVKADYVGFEQEILILSPDQVHAIFLQPRQIILNNVQIFSNTDFIDYVKRSDMSIDRQKADLYQTGRTSLPQALNFSYANINVGHYAIDNVASYLDPVRLNGQDADYVVVLIEGKRRHLFSGLNLNYTTGMGHSGVDLEAIPQNLLQKIEVIPADQSILYGSQGIGGTINFKFDNAFRGLNFRQTTGVTTKGDGLTSTTGLLFGTALPWSKAAFLNLSLTYKKQQSTDRSNNYKGLVYRSASDTSKLNSSQFSDAAGKMAENIRLDDSLVSARHFNRNVSRYGDGKRSNVNLWYNMSSPVSKNWRIYSFGGVSYRSIRTYGFYRFPNDYKSASPLYPEGYLPEDPASLTDVAITAGIARKKWNGYDIDFSTTYGHNAFKSATDHTVNPSMGIYSPTSFNLGQTLYGQSVSDFTLNKAFKWRETIHLSTITLGSQFTSSRYQIKAGDESSYLDANPAGTPANELKLSGTNGHLGFSPSNAVSEQRNELAIFGQAYLFLDKNTSFGGGLRYENATSFKSQIATSFDLKRDIGRHFTLHGSYNQSAKLPTLQQLYFSQTQYQFFPRNGISDVYKIMQINSSSEIRSQLGIPDLKVEKMQEFHFSANYKTDRLSIYLSYNKIIMKDRLLVADLIAPKNAEYIKLLKSSDIDAIQFFRNIPGSSTHIIQLIGTYDLPIAASNKNLNFEGHFAYNRSHLNTSGPTVEQISLESDRIFKGIVEDGQPKVKVIGKINYQTSKYSIYLRNTYFGPVWYRDSKPDLDQYFGGKVISDLGASWSKSKALVFTMAFNNLLNIYPDKVVENTALNTNRTFGDQIVYSRQTSQFGLYGTYISFTINYKF